MARRTVATSASYELSGNCTAVTFNPLATSNGITFDQLDASAQAPWTRTTFDILLIGFLLGSSPPEWRAWFCLSFVIFRKFRDDGALTRSGLQSHETPALTAAVGAAGKFCSGAGTSKPLSEVETKEKTPPG